MTIIALHKFSTGERFIFHYDDESILELLRTFGRMAADPESSFTWYEAAMMTMRVKRMENAAK